MPEVLDPPAVDLDAPVVPGGGVDLRVRPKRRPRPAEDAERQQQPPHAVILHNDPINTFEYVIRCLRKVFGYGGVKAFVLTMRAHTTGRAVVWTGMKEHAELKAEQLVSCGPDPVMKARGAGCLGVTVEPVE